MKFLIIFLVHSLLFDCIAPLHDYYSPLQLNQLRSMLKSKFQTRRLGEQLRDQFREQFGEKFREKFTELQLGERLRNVFSRGDQLTSSMDSPIDGPLEISPVKERINDKFVKRLMSRPDRIESRVLLDFLADPSIFVTMLSSLEQMYMTFPFGFLLKPIVNFFRVPNRRRKRSPFFIDKPFK